VLLPEPECKKVMGDIARVTMRSIGAIKGTEAGFGDAHVIVADVRQVMNVRAELEALRRDGAVVSMELKEGSR
jgi:hypothetical protein